MPPFTAPRDMARARKLVPDPGSGVAIQYKNWGSCLAITTGSSGETNTLPDPKDVGELFIITMDTDGGGDRVVTASTALNQTGNTIMTFGAVLDTVTLTSITDGSGGFRWHIVGNDGVALS